MKNIMILLLCLSCASCILDGTDTGNPGIDNPTNCSDSGCDQMSGGGYESKISGVIYEVCQLINDCKSQSMDSCRKALKTQRNIDTEVGLADSDYETVNDIIIAERYGFLIADSQAARICEEDISRLECIDTGVDESYDASLNNPYEKTADVLPTSCIDIFSNSPSDEEEDTD